jgi:type IV pilus assembly protein PilC
MPNFYYKALNDVGGKVGGVLFAENPSELSSMLKSSNLELISFKEEKKSPFSRLFAPKISDKDKVAMFVHLDQLERAGVSIVDSIIDLKENADSKSVRGLMQEVYESIKKGSMFSESLAKRPDAFSTVYVGLIETGEKTGNLANSFTNIIEDLKWGMDMKRKTRKATIGPSFGIVLMCAVTGTMTTVVVPKVTGFLLGQGIDLPFATRALIAFSDFVKAYWMYVIATPPALWITFKILTQSEKIAVIVDDFKLKLPIIGPILNKIDAAKFCQFFGMTFKSGLGVLECLDASASVIKNRAIRKSIIGVKAQVSDGQSLAESISSTGYFPSLVARMFKIGEDSGNMEEALKNIKFFYDREINDSIDRLVSLIQPSITMVMGGMIAWIVVAVFGPVYGMFSKL